MKKFFYCSRRNIVVGERAWEEERELSNVTIIFMMMAWEFMGVNNVQTALSKLHTKKEWEKCGERSSRTTCCIVFCFLPHSPFFFFLHPLPFRFPHCLFSALRAYLNANSFFFLLSATFFLITLYYRLVQKNCKGWQ